MTYPHISQSLKKSAIEIAIRADMRPDGCDPEKGEFESAVDYHTGTDHGDCDLCRTAIAVLGWTLQTFGVDLADDQR